MASIKVLTGNLRGKFPESACILVEEAGTRILIDTGCLGQSTGALEADLVVYTHYHPDHIRGHRFVRAERVYAPVGEEPYHTLEDLAKRFAPPIWRRWAEMAQLLIGVNAPPSVTDYYEPGEDICVRGVCIKTIPASGHLATHVILELPGRVAHLSDVDLTSFGPWYGNPEASLERFIDDIQVAAGLDVKLYTTSHVNRLIDKHEARHRLLEYAGKAFEHMRSLLDKAAALGRSSIDAHTLTGRGIVYKKYIEGYEDVMSYFEANMLSKILHLLSTLGCVKPVRGGYTVVSEGSCEALEEYAGRVSSAILSNA